MVCDRFPKVLGLKKLSSLPLEAVLNILPNNGHLFRSGPKQQSDYWVWPRAQDEVAEFHWDNAVQHLNFKHDIWDS